MSAIGHYNSAKHRAWAEKVLRRDKYLCQRCKRYGKKVPATVAHHIKHIDEHPELAFSVANGIAVCAVCHNRLHPEKGIPPTSRKRNGGVIDRGAEVFPPKNRF